MKLRLFAVVAAVAITLVAIGCNDPTNSSLVATTNDTLTVYALTGSPLSYPSALNVGARATVRPTGDFDYDIAFDINAAGKVVLYPIRILGGSFTATRTVGIQKVNSSFDALDKAPTSGYNFDSTTVVSTGDVVAIETVSSSACALSLVSVLYAKMAIDIVDPTQRAIRFRLTVDPNCGFLSLAPGVPKS